MPPGRGSGASARMGPAGGGRLAISTARMPPWRRTVYRWFRRRAELGLFARMGTSKYPVRCSLREQGRRLRL